MDSISLYALEEIGLIEEGDDLPGRRIEACEEEDLEIQDNDIIVISSKVVSFHEGRVVDLEDVDPSPRAKAIANSTGMLEEEVQLILREGEVLASIPVRKFGEEFVLNQAKDKETAKKALENIPSMLLTKRNGRICTSAGVDLSNSPEGKATLLPRDPDESARKIREKIEEETGKNIAVIISDSEVTIRGGSMDIAIGCSGIEPIDSNFGAKDLFGKPKLGGIDMKADEVTGAAALLFGQTSERVPVALARGVDYEEGEGVSKNSELLGKGLKHLTLSSIKMKILKLLPKDT